MDDREHLRTHRGCVRLHTGLCGVQEPGDRLLCLRTTSEEWHPLAAWTAMTCCACGVIQRGAEAQPDSKVFGQAASAQAEVFALKSSLVVQTPLAEPQAFHGGSCEKCSLWEAVGGPMPDMPAPQPACDLQDSAMPSAPDLLGCSGFSATSAMLLALLGASCWAQAADCRRRAGSDITEALCQCCRETRLPPARQKRCLLALDVQQRLKGSSWFKMLMRTRSGKSSRPSTMLAGQSGQPLSLQSW